ncbi:MAG: hypothetical protein RIB60_08170 [Phycisphaerales bacterium]
MPTETHVEQIQIDWAALSRFEPLLPEPIVFPLPEGGAIVLAMQHGERFGSRSYTAYGQIAGVANSSVILCVHEDAVRLYVQNSTVTAAASPSARARAGAPAGGTGDASCRRVPGRFPPQPDQGSPRGPVADASAVRERDHVAGAGAR